MFTASEIVPPTMGTPLETANFAVRISTLSAEFVTNVCAESTLMNTVISRESPHTAALRISSPSLSVLISGGTAPVTESPITVPQTGVRKLTEICEKNCAAASMTVLAAEAAAAFPIAAITPANTGTNTSMNSEAAESTSSVSRSAPDIAAVVIPAPARTPTAENTPDMFPPAPSAELRESAQSITTPHSDANSRSGSVSLSISMSRRNSGPGAPAQQESGGDHREDLRQGQQYPAHFSSFLISFRFHSRSPVTISASAENTGSEITTTAAFPANSIFPAMADSPASLQQSEPS